MDFFLFCLLNAVLFLRPSELVPGLSSLPIYAIVILAALAVSLPHLSRKLQLKDLIANPINLCVVGLVFAVPLSHLRHLDFWSARYSFSDFGKTALYFLLFVSVIRTEKRLEQFLRVLLILLGVMTSLSLLQHHGLIYLPQLDPVAQSAIDGKSGEQITVERTRGTGIFNDPNDYAMILVVGLVLAAQATWDSSPGTKPLWAAFIAAMGYTLFLTKSRGGFLALLAAAGMFGYARWGWKRALMVAVLMLPLVAAVFAMRGDEGMDSGTGQQRIQLWAQGFALWKHSLPFGIGYGMYAEEIGHVAHNSFVHCFVELGLFGGTLFFGCFYFAFDALLRQRSRPEIDQDTICRRRTDVILPILTGATAAMWSLSRAYVVPTYLLIGLGSVAAGFNRATAPATLPSLDRRLVHKLAIATCVMLVGTYVFIRTMAHWG